MSFEFLFGVGDGMATGLAVGAGIGVPRTVGAGFTDGVGVGVDTVLRLVTEDADETLAMTPETKTERRAIETRMLCLEFFILLILNQLPVKIKRSL